MGCAAPKLLRDVCCAGRAIMAITILYGEGVARDMCALVENTFALELRTNSGVSAPTPTVNVVTRMITNGASVGTFPNSICGVAFAIAKGNLGL